MKPYRGRVVLFRAKSNGSENRTLGWENWVKDSIEIREVPGTHLTIFDEPQVQSLARELTDCLSHTILPMLLLVVPPLLRYGTLWIRMLPKTTAFLRFIR